MQKGVTQEDEERGAGGEAGSGEWMSLWKRRLSGEEGYAEEGKVC